MTKSEIAEVISRAADGTSAKVLVVSGRVEPGMKACSPAQAKAVSFDTLTILLPPEAQRLSIVAPGVSKVTAVEAAGVAGVAFQALRDKAMETASDGFSTLSITAAAELGEGPKDISLLGKALGMLPKLDIEVALHLDLDFRGLTGGAPIELTGSAADYQRVEDAILGLAGKASAVAGTLGSISAFHHLAAPIPATMTGFARSSMTSTQGKSSCGVFWRDRYKKAARL